MVDSNNRIGIALLLQIRCFSSIKLCAAVLHSLWTACHHLPMIITYCSAFIAGLLHIDSCLLAAADQIEDVHGVVVVAEMESSRLRMFGEKLTIEDAMREVDGILASVRYNSQVTTVHVSAAAAAMLCGSQGAQELAKMVLETGSSSCQLVDEQGSVRIKVEGNPASLMNVQMSVVNLEKRARQHNKQLRELTDAQLVDTICPVCTYEVAPGSRHIMEPCGHMYCQDCAEMGVKSAVEQAKFPVVCCKAGCRQPLCLEDIKMLLGPAAEYDKALDKSLSLYMRQNAGAGVKPCFSANCKQVGWAQGPLHMLCASQIDC